MMVRSLAFLYLLLFPVLTYAQLESQFTFNGQNAEVLRAESPVTIVTPEQIEVPSTCTREVPVGDFQVCHNERRDREECSWVPSRQRCWTDTDRVCRPVSRTRQECSGAGSREVCHERPSRRVCVTNPQGQRICQDVEGGRVCQRVPESGDCRTVTYTENVCETIPRQRCETIPGRNECTSIPYYEQVCRMETQYRTESYACTRTRTVNRSTPKVLRAETDVQIITNGLVQEFPVAVSIRATSSRFDDFGIEVRLLKEPGVYVVLKKKEVSIESVTDQEIILKGSVVIEVLTKEMLPLSFPASVSSASIEGASKRLTVVFEGPVLGIGTAALKITHKGLIFTQVIASYPSKAIVLGSVGNKAALQIELKDFMENDLKKKDMKMKLHLSSNLNLQAILNAVKPQVTKTFEGIPVELR